MYYLNMKNTKFTVKMSNKEKYDTIYDNIFTVSMNISSAKYVLNINKNYFILKDVRVLEFLLYEKDL